MSLKMEIARNNIIFVLGGIIASVIGFFTSIILARLLGPLGFGFYSFVLTAVGFFVIFTYVITGGSLTRYTANFLSKKEYGKINYLIRFLTKYHLLFSIVVGGILILFPFEISVFIFNKPELSLLVQIAGVILIFTSMADFLTEFLLGVKDFKYITLFKILDKTLKFLFPLILVLLGFGYLGAVGGLVIASILSIIFILLLFRKYSFILKSKISKINKKNILNFGFWSFLSNASVGIFMTVDSFMISILRSVEELGFYRIANTWTFALVTFVPISGFVIYPYFSGKQSKETLNKTFSNSVRYSLMLILPMAFLLSAFSESVINLFYGLEYSGSIEVLSILSFASVTIILSGIFGSYFSGVGRPDLVTKIVFATLGLNIILNYILINSVGIIGAAIATLLSRFLEIIIYVLIAVLIDKMSLKASYLLKPLLASLIMYYIAIQFSVSSILEFVVYGIVSLSIYGIIMLAIKGIRKSDIKAVTDSLRF